MNRIASVVVAVTMIGVAACDAPSVSSPSGGQPSFDKGGNVAVHECHDTATTNAGNCGSVAVGGNKAPVITRFSLDSTPNNDAWFTAVFTGTGSITITGSCFGPLPSVTVTSGVPFDIGGGKAGGGYFTLTAANSLGSVSSTLYVNPFFGACS